MTEMEMREYISQKIPGISYDGIRKIIDMVVYKFYHIDVAITCYKLDQEVDKWIRSKNKHFYRVRMYNNGYKYVYMCPEQVEHMWKDRYEQIKEVEAY